MASGSQTQLPPINSPSQPQISINASNNALEQESDKLSERIVQSTIRNAIERSQHSLLFPPIDGSNNLTKSSSKIANTIRSNSRAVLNGGDKALNDALNIDQSEVFITQRAGKLLNTDEQKAISTTNLLTRRVKRAVKNPFVPEMQMQSTMVLRKQKEFDELKRLHEQKLLEFEKRMKECEEKRKELESKRAQIRDRMKKFDKFIKENDAKRQRALLKAQTERKLTEQKDGERHTLLDLCKQHMSRLERYGRLIGKLKKFEKFLQNLLVEHFTSGLQDGNEAHINDILIRFKTLSETNVDLMQVMQVNNEKVDKLQVRLMQLQAQKAESSLRQNSELSRLKEIYEKQIVRTTQLEQNVEELQVNGKQKMRMVSQANLAIEDLFMRAAKPLLNHLLLSVKDDEQLAKATAAAAAAAAREEQGIVGDAVGGDNTNEGAYQRKKTPAVLARAKQADSSAAAVIIPQTFNNLSPTEKVRMIQEKILDIKDVCDKVQIIIQKEKVKNAELAIKKNSNDQEKLERQKQREQELAQKRALIQQTRWSRSNLSIGSMQTGSIGSKTNHSSVANSVNNSRTLKAPASLSFNRQ